MADEIAWLIERAAAGEAETRLTDGPRYLMGIRQGYGAMWTTDHEHAVRFSRRIDGERIAEHLECAARVVEHMWCEQRRDIMDGRGRRDITRNPHAK